MDILLTDSKPRVIDHLVGDMPLQHITKILMQVDGFDDPLPFNTSIQIAESGGEDITYLVLYDIPKRVELKALARDKHNPPILQQIANHTVAKANKNLHKCFRVVWKGNKIPRRVQLGNMIIMWTQSGMVAGQDITSDPRNQYIGVYDRLAEFEGPGGNYQEMRITLN